ncbi:MAG: metallophosphoesterase [Bryobacterales bacterium]|nr:metallophosphoesterase [Bryobacterales bacterium]
MDVLWSRTALELLLLALSAYVQARLIQAAAERIRRRAPRFIPALWAAAALWCSWLVAGVVLNLPSVYYGGVPAWSRTFCAVPAFLWLVTSTGSACLWWIWRQITEPRFDPEKRRLLRAGGSALAAAPFAAAGFGGLIVRRDFRTVEADLTIPGLPKALDGLRIVQLSDIHLGPFLSEDDLAWVVGAANETQPHLAVVTGDLISAPGDPLDQCLQQLAALKSDAGILGCLGNHERYARAEAHATREGQARGIRFLRGETERLVFGGAALNIAGVDYQSVRQRRLYLKNGEKLVAPDAVNLLLTHNPDVLPAAARLGFDAALAGHTHGGQVTVEILSQSLNVARFMTPYVYGRYSEGRTAMFVTRGIGTIGLPLRLGAPPEIALVRLRAA